MSRPNVLSRQWRQLPRSSVRSARTRLQLLDRVPQGPLNRAPTLRRNSRGRAGQASDVRPIAAGLASRCPASGSPCETRAGERTRTLSAQNDALSGRRDGVTHVPSAFGRIRARLSCTDAADSGGSGATGCALVAAMTMVAAQRAALNLIHTHRHDEPGSRHHAGAPGRAALRPGLEAPRAAPVRSSAAW